MRVAVIDRDGAFLRSLSEHIEQLEWELAVHAAPVATGALLEGDPHALVVDVGLLGPRWDEWLSRWPERLPHLGVVVCTANSTAPQRIRGLRAGADDWVTKPCHAEELCARLQAIVRAHHRGASASVLRPLRAGGLELRPDIYDALSGERRAGLTRREFDIVALLACGGGGPVERDRLYKAIWGFEMARGDRSMDTFVRKIRHKLRGVSPEWRYIHTHRGTGYSFAAKRARGKQPQE